jgi:2,3-diketo-5-methylthio-1-phosphopentane phosphatase
MPFGYNIFIDFDGTITGNDVGYEMFKHFTGGATEPLVELYRRGKINSLQCLTGECEIWNAYPPATGDIEAYLAAQELRVGFGDFVAAMKSKGADLAVLSEGFDFYIDELMSNHGIDGLARIANTAHLEDGRLTPAFPYFADGCGQCSNCKGYHIRRLRPPGNCAIFIGDGHSDFHAAEAADIVFARSFLAESLGESGRRSIPYEDFFEIKRRVIEIMEKGLFAASTRIHFCFFSERHFRDFRSLWEKGEVMKNVGYSVGLQWDDRRFEDRFRSMMRGDDAIYMAIEGADGGFIGEAKLAYPDDRGFCHHDVKLLPEFQGRGLGREAWEIILERSASRWPESRALVTPSVENSRATAMYLDLGFEFAGSEEIWMPPPDAIGAEPVKYRKMIQGRK